MAEPIRLDALLAEEFDTIEIPVEIEEPDELDETEPIDDYAPAPEFADFDVWCEDSEDWAAAWRPLPDGPWICRNCGKIDHPFRDHEGAGA